MIYYQFFVTAGRRGVFALGSRILFFPSDFGIYPPPLQLLEGKGSRRRSLWAHA